MAEQTTRTRVTILTESYRIKGFIDLIPGARVTDYVNDAKGFIAITDAEVWELAVGGRQMIAAPFLNVARDHIQVITPQH
jgi:hypothetical protein